MREYELIVVFNLSYAEADGQDAAPKYLENILTNHRGNILKIDHWGRRRLAYPVDGMLDADYVLSRVELDPDEVREIESTFRINERILRFMTVRADELPVPAPPREEEPTPVAAAPDAPSTDEADALATEAPGEAAMEVADDDALVTEAPGEAPMEVMDDDAPAAEAPAVDPAAVEAAVEEPGIEAAPEGDEATQDALTDALGVDEVPVEPVADASDAEQEGDEEAKAE